MPALLSLAISRAPAERARNGRWDRDDVPRPRVRHRPGRARRHRRRGRGGATFLLVSHGRSVGRGLLVSRAARLQSAHRGGLAWPTTPYMGDEPIDRVFVAGAGLMGHGIAQVIAATGDQVTCTSRSWPGPRPVVSRIAGNLERSVAKGRLSPRRSATPSSRGSSRRRRLGRGRRGPRRRGGLRGPGGQVGALARARRSRPADAIFASNTRRSRSTGSPRRWRPSVARDSSGCTSSARCRSCRWSS